MKFLCTFLASKLLTLQESHLPTYMNETFKDKTTFLTNHSLSKNGFQMEVIQLELEIKLTNHFNFQFFSLTFKISNLIISP